jgi:hypothetical protein
MMIEELVKWIGFLVILVVMVILVYLIFQSMLTGIGPAFMGV